MKPVNQTVRGKLGNCFAACVASILELPIESLPDHFVDEEGNADDHWVDLWVDFLRPYGLGIIYADAMFSRQPQGYAIAEMAVKDHPWNHAVVCLNGEVVHDPLGIGYEFERVVRWYVFTALDASLQGKAGVSEQCVVCGHSLRDYSGYACNICKHHCKSWSVASNPSSVEAPAVIEKKLIEELGDEPWTLQKIGLALAKVSGNMESVIETEQDYKGPQSLPEQQSPRVCVSECLHLRQTFPGTNANECCDCGIPLP